MKYHWDKKYLYWGVTAFIVLALSIAFCFLLFNLDVISGWIDKAIEICSPIIAGLVIAFLLSPLVNWLEKRVFYIFYHKKGNYNELSPRLRNFMRVLSILISFIIVFVLLYAFFYSIIPQLIDSVKKISSQSILYKNNLDKWFSELGTKSPEFAEMIEKLVEDFSASFEKFKEESLMPKVEVFVTNVSLGVFNFVNFLWDVIIGGLISIYILFNKEKFLGQFKKLIYGFITIKVANVIVKNIRMINDKFSGFIVGKILDSIIMGILVFIGCTIFKFDYPVLIAIIIGVTNIVPFFGPIFGAIPCIFLLLMINPLKAVYFFVFILAMQQFDGNVLGPKILGVSTGISSFWVIFSITIFGGIWGVPGMIIGTPLFAVLYTIVKSILEVRLEKKNLRVNTNEYIGLDYIEFLDDETKYVNLDYNEYNTKESMIEKIRKKTKNKKNQ